jgi:hypothetical protein
MTCYIKRLSVIICFALLGIVFVVPGMSAAALEAQTLEFIDLDDGPSYTMDDQYINVEYGDGSFRIQAAVTSDPYSGNPIVYSSMNTNIATVDQTGTVTIVGTDGAQFTYTDSSSNVGETQIVATIEGDATYASAEIRYNLRVFKQYVQLYPDDITIYVGDSVPAFTYTMEFLEYTNPATLTNKTSVETAGLLAGDTFSSEPSFGIYATDYVTYGTSKPGRYEIEYDSATADNYRFYGPSLGEERYLTIIERPAGPEDTSEVPATPAQPITPEMPTAPPQIYDYGAPPVYPIVTPNPPSKTYPRYIRQFARMVKLAYETGKKSMIELNLTDAFSGDTVGTITLPPRTDTSKIETEFSFFTARTDTAENYLRNRYNSNVLGSFETKEKDGWGTSAIITVSLESLGFQAKNGTRLFAEIYDTESQQWYESTVTIVDGNAVYTSSHTGITVFVLTSLK